ncbi:hypothetical protein MCEME20_00218 [Candidatus Pelagibacterales bacterium]
MLSIKNNNWLNNFVAKYKRKPCILHIGNIANNAYNNAKILNQAGLDCDVLCYDYYHMMACPEWEDAIIERDYGSHFHPKWFSAGIKNFKRPAWFVQGPLRLCLKYLIAKRNKKKNKFLWLVISYINKTRNTPFLRFGYLIYFSFKIVSKISRSRIIPFIKVNLLPPIIVRFIVLILEKIKFSNLLKTNNNNFYYSSVSIIKYINRELSIEFKKENFPQIKEFRYFNYGLTNKFTQLFRCYDFIIVYSTDPIIPLICKNPYFSFEHGTLRDIPYEKNDRAKLTSLAYRKSIHTFVTNFDCKESANYLTKGRFTTINHPFDEDDKKIPHFNLDKMRKNLLTLLDSDFLFFHPTRHDWLKKNAKEYADKANDKFLKVFVKLRKQGLRIGLITCDWGENVMESKKILSNFNKNVYWEKPFNILKFKLMCNISDIVVDQFKLGSFGGVVFKALATGTPVLTYLEKKKIYKQFKIIPPVINCKSEKEIEYEIKKIFKNVSLLKDLGSKSEKWIKKYHGKAQTVNLQVDQFRLYYLKNKKKFLNK